METINLKQKAVADRIVEHGKKLGVQQHLIDAAVKFAYFESRLGEHQVNRNALGIFQYMPKRWKEQHQKDVGDRLLPDNQIAAMYRDLQAFEKRYNDLSRPQIPRGTVTLEEYLYIKHHDGTNGTAFEPMLRPDGKPNGLKVYRDNNPKYDATAIFGPKTSAAPIRNPWEITFGLPGVNGFAQAASQHGPGRIINWFQPAWLKLNDDGVSVAPASPSRSRPYGPSASAYGPPSPSVDPSSGRSLPWPVIDHHWRTPEPPWGTTGRSYFNTHYFDPNTGASVSTRHRFKRAVAEMTDAMASTAPREGFGAGAPEAWVSSTPRHAMLAAQI